MGKNLVIQELLYKGFAKYYDRIYSYKNYKKECAWLDGLIQKHKQAEGNKLLDLACGTGNHIYYLKEKYECTGLDKNSEMLMIAESKLPGIQFYKQDMIRLIPGKYDIIISMFSSIAYVQSYLGFRSVIDNINFALNPGGIIIIQPWFEADKFTPGIPYAKNYDNGLAMVRMSTAKIEGICSVMEYHYLVYEENKIKHFADNHIMALFNIEKLIEIMAEKNIKAEFIPPQDKEGRGLIIGIKNTE